MTEGDVGVPGDAQPVFDLIVRRATELRNVQSATLFEYDGGLVHIRAAITATRRSSMSPHSSLTKVQLFPMAPDAGFHPLRAILDGMIVHIRDMTTRPSNIPGWLVNSDTRSQVSIPLMRDGRAIGAIATGASWHVDGFTDTQIELLQTFAEQAVIAITSAETYRALQTRTSDLQETLEHQTATSDVLKVISRSTSICNPCSIRSAETAARLCDADQAAIFRREGGLILVCDELRVSFKYEAHLKGLGT